MSIFGIFIIALIMSFAFSPYKKNNPVAPLLVLFFMLLLAGLAAQYWVIPFGPRGFGISWFPVLILMFVFGLLFSFSPGHRRKKAAVEQEQQEAAGAMGIFIWIILFVLLAVVIAGIYRTPDAMLV